mmetsp:Transcript_42613/g.96333  ORF Transcript_42613/g.96333 Transcript_42613/m.96333 type:complete len:246 (-) Transcript_42613:439-1176(-)
MAPWLDRRLPAQCHERQELARLRHARRLLRLLRQDCACRRCLRRFARDARSRRGRRTRHTEQPHHRRLCTDGRTCARTAHTRRIEQRHGRSPLRRPRAVRRPHGGRRCTDQRGARGHRCDRVPQPLVPRRCRCLLRRPLQCRRGELRPAQLVPSADPPRRRAAAAGERGPPPRPQAAAGCGSRSCRLRGRCARGDEGGRLICVPERARWGVLRGDVRGRQRRRAGRVVRQGQGWRRGADACQAAH